MENKELMKKDLLISAIGKWGKSIQLIMVIEEMAELTKAISKNFRGEDNRDKILEETADVFIMLEQIKIIFNIKQEELNDVIDSKMKRLEKRLNIDNKESMQKHIERWSAS